MPREGSTSNEKTNKTPWSKKLNSWLVQRFADLKQLFTSRLTTNPSISPFTPIIERRYLGSTSNQLARQVFNRASLSLSPIKAVDLPLISGVSQYILSRFASSPTVWKQALSLPWIRQRRRQSARLSSKQYESADWQPTEQTMTLSQNLQVEQSPQHYPVDEETQSESEQAETYQVISEKPFPLVTGMPSTQPIASKEPLRTSGESTRHKRVTTIPSGSEKVTVRRTLADIARAAPVTQEEYSVSSMDDTYPAVIKNLLSPPVSLHKLGNLTYKQPYNSRTDSLTLAPGEVAHQQHAEEAEISDASGLSHIYQSDDIRGSAGESHQYETIIDKQKEGIQEKPAKVRQRRQIQNLTQSLSKLVAPITQRYLTQPLSRVLTPIIHREALEPGRFEPQPYTASESIDKTVASLKHTYEQKQIRQEADSGSVTAKQTTTPIIASSTENQSPDESTERTSHTYIALTSQQPITVQTNVFTDQKPGLIQPGIADEISRRFSQPKTQETVRRLDSSVSSQPAKQGVTSDKGSGVPPSQLTPRPVPKEGQPPVRKKVARRLPQQTPKKAKIIHTSVDELTKNPNLTAVQRTTTEPPSPASGLTSLKQEVSSDKDAGVHPPKQTTQTAPEADQSSEEGPATNNLQQRVKEKAGNIKTSMNELIKSTSHSSEQKKTIGPDVAGTYIPLSQGTLRSDSSRELKYRVDLLSKPEISPTQTSEPTVNRVTNGPEIPNLDTEIANSISRDLDEGYTEKALSYRQPLSLTSPVTRPITVIRDVTSTMDMPSQQLYKTMVNRHMYDRGEDHGFLKSGEYRTAFSDHKYTNQPSIALPIASSVRPKTESSTNFNDKLFKYSSETIPELPYSRNHGSGNHNGLELALAPVSRVTETSNKGQTATQEPQESVEWLVERNADG